MNNPFIDVFCPHCGEFVNPIYEGDCPNCGEYMSVKNTLLSEFFSEALVILVKKLVNLFHDLLHNIHP